MAALLTALFIFPASLLRPLGGYLSDRFGPRPVTYCMFLLMTAAIVPLCLPASVLPLTRSHSPPCCSWSAWAWGSAKASVYKYVPNYFPERRRGGRRAGRACSAPGRVLPAQALRRPRPGHRRPAGGVRRPTGDHARQPGLASPGGDAHQGGRAGRRARGGGGARGGVVLFSPSPEAGSGPVRLTREDFRVRGCPVRVDGDDVYVQLPPAAELNAELATAPDLQQGRRVGRATADANPPCPRPGGRHDPRWEGGLCMDIEPNEADGETVVLRAGDPLAAVPRSHRRPLSGPVLRRLRGRAVLPHPDRHPVPVPERAAVAAVAGRRRPVGTPTRPRPRRGGRPGRVPLGLRPCPGAR